MQHLRRYFSSQILKVTSLKAEGLSSSVSPVFLPPSSTWQDQSQDSDSGDDVVDEDSEDDDNDDDDEPPPSLIE